MSNKFYFCIKANQDEAFKSGIHFAITRSKNDPDIEQIIILLFHTKNNIDIFKRGFGNETIKELFKDVPYEFKTKITYKDINVSKPQDIVICYGLNSEDILRIDQYRRVKHLIAIHSLKTHIAKWILARNAQDILGEMQISEYLEPSCIVRKAMEELTGTQYNEFTGLDGIEAEDTAKTFISALHRYEKELNSNHVWVYLVRHENWKPEHAKYLEDLINILNQGRHFQGGKKTGLKSYYKKWKEICKE
jgi:hypothetical protein